MRPAAMDAWRHRWWQAALALVVASAYVAFPNAVPDFRPDQQNDPFTYIWLARTLSVAQAFPTKHWMPGFPLLLSSWITLVGLDFLRLKLLMIATSAVGVGAAYVVFRAITASALAALLLAAALAAVPLFFDYSHRLMSEIPFLAATMVALAALASLNSLEGGAGARRLWGVALVVATGAAVLIRGNGLALVPAIAVGLWRLRRDPARWWMASALAVALLVFGAWSSRSAGRSYAGIHNITYLQEIQAADVGMLWNAGGYGPGVERLPPAMFIRRAYRNFAWYHVYGIADLALPFARGLSGVERFHAGALVALLLCVPVAVGSVVLAARAPVAAAYLVAAFGLVLAYPTGGAPRMLLPAVPLLLLAAFLGMERLAGWRTAIGWVAVVLLAGLFQCTVQGRMQAAHPYSYDEFADYLELVRHDLAAQAEPDDPVVAPHDDVVLAFTNGLPTSPAGLTASLTEGRACTGWLIERDSMPSETLPGQLVRQKRARRGEFVLWRVGTARPCRP